MARVDSLIFFLLGFAQLILSGVVGGDPILELLAILLQGTGGSSLVLGLYFLLFVAKHQKEFNESYSKLEKTKLIRDPNTGELTIEDATPVVNKALYYLPTIGLTMLGAIVWLAS